MLPILIIQMNSLSVVRKITELATKYNFECVVISLTIYNKKQIFSSIIQSINLPVWIVVQDLHLCPETTFFFYELIMDLNHSQK